MIQAGAVALVWLATCAASAQDFGDPDERQQQLEPVPGLSENLSGVVRPSSEAPLERIDTLRDIFRALGACWHLPEEAHSGQEVTLRLAFRRDGEVLGSPRITYSRSLSADRDRWEAVIRSVYEAFARCRPLPFTEKLGAAVAGRVFIFRFSNTRPM
jgi:hypothetical protein